MTKFIRFRATVGDVFLNPDDIVSIVYREKTVPVGSSTTQLKTTSKAFVYLRHQPDYWTFRGSHAQGVLDWAESKSLDGALGRVS